MLYDLQVTPTDRTHNQPTSLQKLRVENEVKEKDSLTHEEENTHFSLKNNTNVETLAKKDSLWKNEENLQKERVINELQTIDAEVRAHEMTHLSIAGAAATSAPTYVYVTGPDGKQYAVGGQVSISLTSVPGNLEATIQKARAIRNAALAVGDPSSADLAVAAAATQMEMAALAALAKERVEKMKSSPKAANELQTNNVLQYPAAHAYNSVAMQLHDADPIIDMYA